MNWLKERKYSSNELERLLKEQSEKMDKAGSYAEKQKIYSELQPAIDSEIAACEAKEKSESYQYSLDSKIQTAQDESADEGIKMAEVNYALRAKGYTGSKLSCETIRVYHELKRDGNDFGSEKICKFISNLGSN